jgi:hypothetical protein
MVSKNSKKQPSISTDVEITTTDSISSEVTTQLNAKERLRQARWSFNLALAMSLMCGIFSLVGVGLSFSGDLPEGSIAIVQTLLTSVPCWLQLAKDSNDRLDK